MPGFTPKKVPAAEIKAKLLRPSLTAQFLCTFNPPAAVLGSPAGQYYRNLDNGETLSLLCSDAALPGTSLMTAEQNDDRTGVTERFAYRRSYDNIAEFSFFIDTKYRGQSYNLILFFEEWIRYTTGDTSFTPNGNFNYRVNFPDGPTGYRTEMFLSKFEKDHVGNFLEYTFVKAFPINISAMPVSYSGMQLLKCSVGFTFNRYFARNLGAAPSVANGGTATNVPNPQDVSYAGQKPATDVFTGSPSISGNYFNNIAPNRSNQQVNEYYNNFGDNTQNSTNFADFTDGSNTGAFGQAVA